MRLGYVLIGSLDVRHILHISNGNWSTSTPSVGQFFSILLPASMAPLGQFLYVFLLVIAVSALAFYTTRLIGSAKYGRLGRRNIEIIESMGVGPQSFIHIVKVGEQYILIGVTRGQVNILTQLEADHLNLSESSQTSAFESLMNRFQKKEDPPEN